MHLILNHSAFSHVINGHSLIKIHINYAFEFIVAIAGAFHGDITQIFW